MFKFTFHIIVVHVIFRDTYSCYASSSGKFVTRRSLQRVSPSYFCDNEGEGLKLVSSMEISLANFFPSLLPLLYVFSSVNRATAGRVICIIFAIPKQLLFLGTRFFCVLTSYFSYSLLSKTTLSNFHYFSPLC